METKKNAKAKIEQLRYPIGLTALLFTGSVVLASFSYTTGNERQHENLANINAADIDFIEITTDVEPPQDVPQQNVMLPPDDNIIIDSNNTQDPPDVTIVLPPPPDIKTGDVTVKEKKIIEFPDIEATFPGGAAAMQQWIVENVNYPQTSIEIGEQGRVYLSFVVEEDGSISNIQIERGVSDDLDREAKRLMRIMPHWVPGEASGRKARTRCRLPINFTLQ